LEINITYIIRNNSLCFLFLSFSRKESLSAFSNLNMASSLVIVIGGKIKVFKKDRLPSSILMPFIEPIVPQIVCLKYKTKIMVLKSEIQCLQKISAGRDLDVLNNYLMWCSAIIDDLARLEKKIQLTKLEEDILLQKINEYTLLSHLFDKLLWEKACDLSQHSLVRHAICHNIPLV